MTQGVCVGERGTGESEINGGAGSCCAVDSDTAAVGGNNMFDGGESETDAGYCNIGMVRAKENRKPPRIRAFPTWQGFIKNRAAHPRW